MARTLNVLWATDGSDASLAAVPLIRSLVLPVTSVIHVLAVAPKPVLSGARPDPIYFKPWTAAERDAARNGALGVAQASAAQLGASDARVEVHARFGHPIQEILRAAAATKANLIVVGAKGSSDLRMMLLGSVAQGVLQYAKRPVLVVRSGTESVRTVVAGIDGSQEALNALEFVQRLGLPPSAQLVLTRVVQLIRVSKSPRGRAGDAFSVQATLLNDQALETATADLAAAGLQLRGSAYSVRDALPQGRPGEQLIDTALKHGAELIVVGSRAPSRARRYLLGGTAEFVARESPTSVLLVR